MISFNIILILSIIFSWFLAIFVVLSGELGILTTSIFLNLVAVLLLVCILFKKNG